MVVAKKFILHKQFKGLPTLDDFKLVEEHLSTIKDHEFLAQAVYLSVDPYMRALAQQQKVGKPFFGRQIAKVIESHVEEYPVDAYIFAYFPWQTHIIYNIDKPNKQLPDIRPEILPDIGNLSLSLHLGVLGIPGHTAYFGFLEICCPKKGDVVVVSGAGGAVGSHVGQMAKIKSCMVIGIVGDDEKGAWITTKLGFDYYINHRMDDIVVKLLEYAKDGIDCYFDNVGGNISSEVISQMKDFGRIAVCGSISTYNEDLSDPPTAPTIQRFMAAKQLKMEGFKFTRWEHRLEESFKQNLLWIKEKKLKPKETVTQGFGNTSQAFIDMLQGKNYGKAIVKV